VFAGLRGAAEFADVAASADTALVDESAGWLYRGVSADHPAIEAARAGKVVPGNVEGTVTAELHNAGNHSADSPFTSWTRDPSVAEAFANRAGPGGVVLRVPEGGPPPGAAWSWAWSPDIYHEQEVLLRGIREGVEVLSP
jgi:hypothetical protein